MPDADAPLIRDPEDAAAAALAEAERNTAATLEANVLRVEDTLTLRNSVAWFQPLPTDYDRKARTITDVFGGPVHRAMSDAREAGLRVEKIVLPTAYDPGRYDGPDATNRAATFYGTPLEFGDTDGRDFQIITDSDPPGFRRIAPHVRVRKEDLEHRPSLRAVVAAQQAQAQARAEREAMAAQIAESFRGPEDCAACWHKATTGTVPAIYCHSEGCEWEATRKSDVAEMVRAMIPAAGDEATTNELAAMATRILDAGFAPSARSHHAGAVAQADYLAALIAEEAERTAHGGSMLPHSSASDCVRCGIDRALAVVRDARAGSDDE